MIFIYCFIKIELDETETKVYGFWHRNENLIINTKVTYNFFCNNLFLKLF